MRPSKALLNEDIAALWSECDSNSVGEDVHASEECRPALAAELEFLVRRIAPAGTDNCPCHSRRTPRN